MRRFLVIALVAAALGVGFAGTGHAADAPQKKDRNWTPPANDSTVGVLGGPRKDAPPESANPEWRKAQPSAPKASAPIPKVEAGQAVMPSNLSSSPSTSPSSAIPAVPRPEIHVDGPAQGQGTSPAEPVIVQPREKPTGFLPDHPFLSGMVAGLIGTDAGSILYGGPMEGDQNGVVVGYIVRALLIVGFAVLVLRFVWRMMGGGSDEDEADIGAPRRRREPNFGHRDEPLPGGRREPRFGRDDRF